MPNNPNALDFVPARTYSHAPPMPMQAIYPFADPSDPQLRQQGGGFET